MSHDVFGKSACRGECNQPCRRQFLVKAVDFYANENGQPVHDAKAEFLVEPHTVLSAKDLCSLGFVDKLMDAGIASLKIEGRARNANYVKTTVVCYRRAVDEVLSVAEKGNWVTLCAPRCRVGDKVFYMERR